MEGFHQVPYYTVRLALNLIVTYPITHKRVSLMKNYFLTHTGSVSIFLDVIIFRVLEM